MNTMPVDAGVQPAANRPPYIVIAGYGLAGRVIVEYLLKHNLPYCVIELNPQTIARCAPAGVHMIQGDVGDPEVLRQAGIEQATMLTLTLPDESAGKRAVAAARQLNPDLHIIARSAYTSGGLQAIKLGADEAVIAEQLVAHEFSRLVAARLAPESSAPTSAP
jgi:CPA2 family monovalent cation:H+ antiporter-2